MALKVGVIGAGVMGSGIAQTAATAGFETICTDVAEEALDKARASVSAGRFGFERALERGKLSEEQAENARARLTFTTEFEAAAAADIVIECVPEQLDLKIRVIRDLDDAAPENTILASNTSGFPIAAFAAATRRPDRVIGWHWASPPVVMKFAEIVVTEATSEETKRLVCETAEACGKQAEEQW